MRLNTNVKITYIVYCSVISSQEIGVVSTVSSYLALLHYVAYGLSVGSTVASGWWYLTPSVKRVCASSVVRAYSVEGWPCFYLWIKMTDTIVTVMDPLVRQTISNYIISTVWYDNLIRYICVKINQVHVTLTFKSNLNII